MNNVQVDFDVKDEVKVALVGYQEIGCHPIFDINATILTWKVRFVLGRHTMDTPDAMTYASVVSQESVRIALLIAALNNLGLLSAGVQNACLNGPPRWKAWFEAGS